MITFNVQTLIPPSLHLPTTVLCMFPSWTPTPPPKQEPKQSILYCCMLYLLESWLLFFFKLRGESHKQCSGDKRTTIRSTQPMGQDGSVLWTPSLYRCAWGTTRNQGSNSGPYEHGTHPWSLNYLLATLHQKNILRPLLTKFQAKNLLRASRLVAQDQKHCFY